MKTFALTLGSVVTAASLTLAADAAMVAQWDFQTTTNGGTAAVAAPNSPLTYVANFGTGTLYANGTNGSSSWVQANSGNQINAFGGTALNATGSMSTVTTGSAALGLVGGAATGSTFAANGKSIVFKFSMTDLGNLAISYATQRTATGFTTQQWDYSTDGTNWTTGTTISSIQSSFASGTGSATNVSITSGLNNATTAYVRVTFTGATANGGNNRLDNIQFNADAVPAPGALALLGVAGLVGARRRR